MFKIFSIGKRTVLEREINMLMVTGVSYIPRFEKEVSIIEFCSDMKVIYDNNNEEPNLFFIVNGFKEEITLDSCFIEEGVREITLEQLKSMVSNGYSLIGAGTTRVFQHISYKLELTLSDYKVWKITSFNERLKIKHSS